MWLDIRYALRMMSKSIGLTAVLAITLAIGIGASTTIFSVVNSVVLQPLPYEQPQELVRVYTKFNGLDLGKFWMSGPEFADLRNDCRSCESVGAWAQGTASLSGGDRPVRIQAAYLTPEVLPMLGVRPILGRWFDNSEYIPRDPKLGALAYEGTVIVIGYDVWQRAYGGDPGVIGKKITLDAMPVTIVGVMPKGFDFLDRQEAWVPLNYDFTKQNRGGHYLNVIARLKNGVGIEALHDELISLGVHYAKNWPQAHTHSITYDNPYDVRTHPLIAVPFHEDLVGSLSTTLWLLQGAVLLVLLIAIVNVANLLLARSETRMREVAVRHALGASRRRLLRQFLTESVILGSLGGALGILVAVWAVDGVTALIPKSAPRASEIKLDAAAVVFAVGCSFVASLLFGLAPIFHARRHDLHGALKEGARMTGSKTRLRVRRGLVIAEITLAVVLVIGCTVMVRSFLKLQQVDLGFDPKNMLTLQLEVPQKRYPGTSPDVFWHRLHDRLVALPGVEGATMFSGMPPQRPVNANDINFPGRTHKPGEAPWNVDFWQIVGDDFVDTMGARVVAGRGFSKSDAAEAPGVVMINEAFAKRFFPGEDPVGKEVELWHAPPPAPEVHQKIIGVINDIKQAGMDKPSGTEVYALTYQVTVLDTPPDAQRIMWIAIRADGDPDALGPAVTRAIAELDPTLPISSMRSMDDVMWEAVARPRFLTFLLTSFAGIALLLAAVGIYGVMAHTVAQRTHEIGLRVALGAQPSDVRAMVLRQASVLVAIGVGAGLAVAIGLQLVLSNSLGSVFYGEELSQPVLLAGVAIAVVVTALIATWIPARRATKVEPTVALRSE